MDTHDLLPPDSGLRARELAIAPGTVAVVAEATSSVALCPGCGASSEHLHGRYTRTVADLPWLGRRVVLRLSVRRFQCRNPACPKRTFTERVQAVAPYAQTTARLADAHRAIGFALGGEAGARLAGRLAVPTSPDTILRRVRQAAPIAPRRPGSWASTTSPSAGGGPTARSRSTRSGAAPSTCSRTGKRPPWRRG